jgi:ABC-2 type transport system ATP-binding protein
VTTTPSQATALTAASAKALSKAFGKRGVLDALDLVVEPGLAVGLLGANGAGKTTLLKLLLGLIPADGGIATVFGEPVGALSEEVRGRISYVPQMPGQFAWLTAHAMLKYLSAFYPTFDWDYARALSERLKVSMRTQIGVLSPGQQQRLSIVRALATRPSLLVLDEPIASLDPATRIAVIEELIAERQRRQITILISSHITGDLERLCTHLAVLAKGKIAAFESAATFVRLARVTLEGDEAVLAAEKFAGARAVRRPAAGQRILVVDGDAAPGYRDALASRFRVQVDEPGLEAILTEWMQ